MSLCKVLHPRPNVLPLYCIVDKDHDGDHYAGFRLGHREVEWPNIPATVCVRLDGLADKIAATIHLSHCGMPDCDYDSELPAAADVVLLLQSLAVPR
jgi:hypothetical protein